MALLAQSHPRGANFEKPYLGPFLWGLLLPQGCWKTESHLDTCSPCSVSHPTSFLKMSLLENEVWFSCQVLAFCFKEINPCLENNGGCHKNAECTQTGPNQVSSAPRGPLVNQEQIPESSDWEQTCGHQQHKKNMLGENPERIPKEAILWEWEMVEVKEQRVLGRRDFLSGRRRRLPTQHGFRST